MIVTGNADDANTIMPAFPFSFFYFSTNYQSSLYIGSNSYITFGFGSSVFSGLSATTPGRGLLIQAADNSWQRVWAGTITSSKARLYWEGTSGTSGTVGSPNMVWEVTHYSNNNIMVVISSMGRTSGQNGISNGGTYVIQPGFAASTSWAIESTSSGNSWTFRSGSFTI